jgi:hypothetical protein
LKAKQKLLEKPVTSSISAIGFVSVGVSSPCSSGPLGVDAGASADEIKAGYWRRAIPTPAARHRNSAT